MQTLEQEQGQVQEQPQPEVAVPPPPENEAWSEALWLPCQLRFGLNVPGFTVGHLLRLEVGSVVDTLRPESSDIGVYVNGQMIGWAEIEVVSDTLSFRFTEFL